MDAETYLQSAHRLLEPLATKFETPEELRLDISISPENLVEAVCCIMADGGWHLAAITGLDIPQQAGSEGEIELLYHFCKGAAVVTLRVRVSYGLPEVPTICTVIPSAGLYERELVEMLGVIVDGTPMRTRLLLPDDWPDWVYPLRKSFKRLEQE